MAKFLEELELDALSIFDGEGGDGGEGGDKGGDQGNDDGDDGKGGKGKKGGDDGKPFATFKDEKSFMSRVGREAKKIQSEMLKALGIENEEALKKIIEEKKAADEKAKTELEKANEAKTAAEKRAADAEAKANDALKTAEAKVLAVELGVDPKKVNYLMKLANLAEVEVKDGVVDTEAMKEAIEAVLEDIPELKGESKKKVPDSDGGGEDKKGGKDKPLTLEVIKAMTPAQAAERIDEIRKFMAGNK